MDVTDAIITALRQLSEALEDVQRLQSCVGTLNEGYKTIGQVPAARRVYWRISGFSYRKLNTSYAHSIRHDFVERAPISSLTVAWQAYAERFDVQGLGISTESLEAGLALARLTRNCLAGSHEAKALVSGSEPYIRRAVFQATSFGAIKEERFFPLLRALLQSIANLIAPVDRDNSELLLTGSLIRLYFQEEVRTDQIVLRALDSDDAQVNLSVLMIVLNALKVDPSLIQTLANVQGTRTMAKILDKMTRWSESVSETLEGKCFDLGYQISAYIISSPVQMSLFNTLGSDEEVITPSQLMFLKLLDGYLQSATSASSSSIDIPEVAYLVPHLNAAATFAAPNLKALLESGQDREPAASQDPILPRTLEASILLCQCLIAAALREIPVQHERELLAQSIAGLDQPAGNTLSSLRKAGQATVENLISLLGALEAALPRQKPLRPATESSPGGSLQAFATLKRDVVQLLGLIAYHDKLSQDRIREAAGIHLVLSLCVVDEHNPLIREHALLTIRNLMMNNPENQAVIGTMDPIGMVGPNGELQEMPVKRG
ncbi:spinocerebellar ataxia type 10 protein domain-containing protein [Filobasidium floriforme]|uniref:spinocerebellar ataxia type 10 protein domain-containing protein n=1 Tax=Filobasidium floriforme TaxID=5210 RepID=UPI001E8E9EDD|nr:spinocerebellar ataxia type 10 protein domain-containing protein [Filobasidium floriforme]KAH8082274.1 spinocerebellar ataxia type 10 protein domain-containing protein [Filobasidium floriforme]